MKTFSANAIINRIVRALDDSSTHESLPEKAINPLSPWATWTLFALVRHVGRQHMLAAPFARCDDEFDFASAIGARKSRVLRPAGILPGQSDWEYRLHGIGCKFRNRMNGVVVDVDFHDGCADWIDRYFFREYLDSLKQPDPIDGRLLALHPSRDSVSLAIDELVAAGLLEAPSWGVIVRPTRRCLSIRDQVDRLAELGPTSLLQAERAILLGDWLLAAECMPHAEELLGKRDRCRMRRYRQLERLFKDDSSKKLALLALCELDIDSKTWLERALLPPLGDTTIAALNVISERSNEDWSPQVIDLLHRADPSGTSQEPMIWVKCAAYLLNRQHHVEEIRNDLPSVKESGIDDAALLAMEHFPDLAPEMFRNAIQSNLNGKAVATLVLINQPWSHAVLVDALDESTDYVKTAAFRLGLRLTHRPDLRAVVEGWEKANPEMPGPETDASWRCEFAEYSVQHEMELLHDRVLGLRQRTSA